MAVDDQWFKRGPNGEREKSSKHGRGKRYRVRYLDDQQQRRERLFDRKADASAFDATIRADVARGQYVDPTAGKLTLALHAATWLEGQTFDPSTREAVEIRLRLHILPRLGHHELRTLAQRPSLVQSWASGLRDRLAATTVRVIFANLSAMLSAAVDDGLITRNPCAVGSVKPPTAERRKIRPWSAELVMAIRDGLPERYAATVDAGSGLGLRQGEVLGLSPDDVDWLRRVVHVRRQVKQLRGRLVFAPPKGGKERDVPLSEGISLRLARHLEQWPAQPITLPWGEPTGKPTTVRLMFTGRERGKAVNRNYYNARLWKPALVSAGVISRPDPGERYEESREHGFHALRHAFASALLAEGVDIRSLADYLGHSDPGFTLRVYTHLMPSSADRTRQAVDRAFCTVDRSGDRWAQSGP